MPSTAGARNERPPLTMHERKAALTSFAEGHGHTSGLDELCDEVILAAHTGHLPRAQGLDAEDRHFVQLLYHYQRQRERARIKAGLDRL